MLLRFIKPKPSFDDLELLDFGVELDLEGIGGILAGRTAGVGSSKELERSSSFATLLSSYVDTLNADRCVGVDGALPAPRDDRITGDSKMDRDDPLVRSCPDDDSSSSITR